MSKRAVIFSAAAIAMSMVAVHAMAGDVEAGKAKAPICFGCHGVNGEGRDPTGDLPVYPAIRGQREAYFIQSVKEYKKGVRKNEVMGAIAKGLQDEEIADLAAYYATLTCDEPAN